MLCTAWAQQRLLGNHSNVTDVKKKKKRSSFWMVSSGFVLGFFCQSEKVRHDK